MPPVDPLAIDPLAIALFVGSILAAVLITRHYSQRPAKPNLSAYLVLDSEPFEGVHPDVRRDLRLAYRGDPVDNLRHIEFVIINSGQAAIRECDEPLTLLLPEAAAVLDVSIARAAEGMTVETVQTGQSVSFPFRLMNPDEWFRVKVLLDMDVDPAPEDWALSLRAEQLPARLDMHLLGATAGDKGGDLAGSVLFLVGSVAAAVTVTALYGVLRLLGFDPFALEEGLGRTLALIGLALPGLIVFRLTAIKVAKGLVWGPLPEEAWVASES